MQLPKLRIKKYNSKGDLVYNYAPLHNYRYTEDKYLQNGEYYSQQEIDGSAQAEFIPKYSLVDFVTKKLDYDIQHPLDILPQWSYDGSVNLIINDGQTYPKLINTRFSVLGDSKYQIVDRQGNNDTNIYNDSEDFNTSISLYKSYNLIPKIKFLGTTDNGELAIGNYHFYFKYVDSDGNETDFIGESGLVSIFKGNSRNKVNTGFKNENSHKSVLFRLTNLDTGYQYINVYYTRSTAEANQNKVTNAYKIVNKFTINSANVCNIRIVGTEETNNITLAEINPTYLLAKSVKTQTICQNRLFFGNIQKNEINYRELADLSLYFAPQIHLKPYNNSYDPTYGTETLNTYCDVNFIYNYVGYQNDEIYRFGIVYILNDNTLSPVFNIRGTYFDNNTQWVDNISNMQYSSHQPYVNNVRDYIQYNESTGVMEDAATPLENIYGVTRIHIRDCEFTNIIGIKIKSLYKSLSYRLQKLGVKGYFFVRQPRIPLKICQALTIGVLGNDGIPAPYVNNGYFVEAFHQIDSKRKNQKLTHYYKARTCIIANSSKFGALCPDYDVNYEYLNSFFCGEQFYIKPKTTIRTSFYNTSSGRVYTYPAVYNTNSNAETIKISILGIEDNVKSVGLNKNLYTSRAGSAEEDKVAKIDLSTNVRGPFGPYLAIDGYNIPGTIVDIYNSDAINLSNLDLFNIRAADTSSYEAISERYLLEEFDENIVYYRGDSYICTFTHRLNRNFQSASAPTNDVIVDADTWANKSKDEDKVNIGDLNAVKIGTWFTFPVISNSNLNIRSVDNSYTEEATINGHSRGFYPYYEANAIGTTKIPEGLCYNKGFNTNLSSRYNFNLPNTPTIKNDFSNRIAYSDISVNDAFKNGFRVFQGTNFRDYPKTYGSITKLVEYQGNIICVFEHGIALIPVNERAVAGQGNGGYVYINTENVLPENPNILSDTLGSQWKDSIIKTNNGIYGVDTVAKKIWMVRGTEVDCISDMKIGEFLNNNINLTEKETTPIIGVKNVKTHYNPYKYDVMFTFYKDNKCWNICYNELQQKWITFYSWLPSFTESINNTMFSFNRDSSKYIAELTQELTSYKYSTGITVASNVLSLDTQYIKLTTKEDYTSIKYSLVNRKQAEYLGVMPIKNQLYFAMSKDRLALLTSEFYERSYTDSSGTKHIINPWNNKAEWINCIYNNDVKLTIEKPLDKPFQPERIVSYVDIKADIEYGDSLTKTITNRLVFIPKHNLQFLTTDFWKHGQAGIIDAQEPIKPTYWYGQQHPFEFEFVVVDNPATHKIFNNLELIANKAKPESFHYEIIGEVYNFVNDKKNIYVRQEAIKHIWQANGVNINYDTTYSDIQCTQNFKSADLYHRYYDRADYNNIVYDSYQEAFSQGSSDYRHISGTEIVYYKNRGEFRIWEHTPAVDIDDQEDTNDSTFGGRGLIASNMQYREDKWLVQINPITILYKNEYNSNGTEWVNSKPPLYINNSPIPDKVYEAGNVNIPKELSNWNIIYEPSESTWVRSEISLKDRFVKIRIRYKGDELAIINYINTLYEQSFS